MYEVVVTIEASGSSRYTWIELEGRLANGWCSCGVIVNNRKDLNDDIEDVSRESIE